MRSLAYTFLLLILAVVVCGLSFWQLRSGNLDSLLGNPPVPVGSFLYDSFTGSDVKYIRVASSGVSATFSLEADGWRATSPWNDRMDPRAAVAIVNFTLGMRVEDHADPDLVEPNMVGLGEAAVNLRLEGSNHEPLARYRLGRNAPFMAEMEGAEQAVPTVYVLPRDKSHKRHLYACTGDISPLFKSGLSFLRDHHPFYFSPAALKMVGIRSQQGELTIGRDRPESPWRIVKPLDQPTDPEAVKTLLEGLFELQALKVSDAAAITPVVSGDRAAKPQQISLTSFGVDEEVVLEIAAPETPEDSVVKATVSNRPGVVFDLPVKPEVGLITLNDLPRTVNDLRNSTLTHLHIPSVAAISIQPATGKEILISRSGGRPWMVDAGSGMEEANEENLYRLLKAVTSGKAIGFASDAATDFSPWGLDRPVLKLRFLGVDESVLELRFGVDKKGDYYVNRLGSPTVMRVDPSMVSSIAVRPYEWRHGRLWSLDSNNLLSIERTFTGGKNEVIKYVIAKDSWESGGESHNGVLDSSRANYLLKSLAELKVSRWLPPTDEACSAALLNPSLTLSVMEKEVDDSLDFKGFITRTLTLAPASKGGRPAFYFGRLNTESHPFIIDCETYQKLSVDLFEK